MDILIVKNNEYIIISNGNSKYKIPISGYENYTKDELLILYNQGKLVNKIG